ncbi:hypothetical protein FMM58_01855 [Campylobacter sp. LR291e]|uniref:hypothetical protein n=1 Tax=unclassified Campylobacter TaxID=2593542 RepID=UPI0012382A21|nr:MULTISPECIES: hypothetical protein [unclassified Campylobacter]KAA6225262.1 hypothetical protein FMM54_06570 [Campylobacter sp. LR185c]KAA6227768.1 hypothetical protein FMM55_02290 [Campylobacter sp. LR196d]KAA6233610.1 hypothetical protein FMM58_01855 [Campylobacter sp. LR291e]KAA8603287.1 hypothetical protein CGP82_08105 [Campylobacter sp. LR185c]
MSKKYLLKHQNKEVLEFEVQNDILDFNTKQDYKHNFANIFRVQNARIINEKFLPLYFSKKANTINQEMQKWLSIRQIPRYRINQRQIFSTLTKKARLNIDEYLNKTLALSINDSYFISPLYKNYDWEKVNLYKNDIDKSLMKVAFLGKEKYIDKGLILSPEFTTGGSLNKAWNKKNDKFYLYKGNGRKIIDNRLDKNKIIVYGTKEAFGEFYMAQIAKIMNFPCVEYDLKTFYNNLVCVCESFTNENEGFVAMSNFIIDKRLKMYFDKNTWQDIMIFDGLIANLARNYTNFGFIINNNTNELLRPAPLFDNGFSLFNLLKENQLRDIENAVFKWKSFFGVPILKQFFTFLQKRHIEGLERLSTFHFIRHSEFNLNEEWLESIENYLQNIAKKGLKQLVLSKNHLNITL